jgi:hypothetical protein
MMMAIVTILQRFRLTLSDERQTAIPDPSLALRPKGGLRVRLQPALRPTNQSAAPLLN